MKVLFKVPRSIGGVDYRKGTHEVPDNMASNWYLLAQIQNGNATIVEGPGASKPAPPAPPAQVPAQIDPPKPSAPSYHEHMAQWESEKEKKSSTATQEEATKMVESGEAQIPAEAVIDEKTQKRKDAAKKAAATRAANKAQSKKDGAAE